MTAIYWDGLTRDEIGGLRARMMTASRVGRLMGRNASTWQKLAGELRDPPPYYSSTSIPALAWGLEHESRAIAEWWERAMPSDDVVENSMVYAGHDHQYSDHLACTPDVLLVRDGVIVSGREFKCPYNSKIHESYVEARTCPKVYRAQLQFSMLVAGTWTWGFSSFDPRRDDDYRCVDIDVPRDAEYIAEMCDVISQFYDGFLANRPFTQQTATAAELEDAL